eukprot:TRINITY_DN3740_c0_g1_i1.p1 TRINITY_DN3740_c0_g1~~TRINITY_DN3740_c0_g1_i1.p1  ORF type:complete len:104 (-),score=28.47 TRINITY_DN3740_c0_g1_i1:39-350(-)
MSTVTIKIVPNNSEVHLNFDAPNKFNVVDTPDNGVATPAQNTITTEEFSFTYDGPDGELTVDLALFLCKNDDACARVTTTVVVNVNGDTAVEHPVDFPESQGW